MKIAKYQDNTVIFQNMQSKLNDLCQKVNFNNNNNKYLYSAFL